MWISWIINILKNRLLISVSVDICIAYLLISLKYISQVGVRNFLVSQFDIEIFLLPLKMPIFYFAIPIAVTSIWLAKFVFDILCLFSRTFILEKIESIRETILQNNTAQHLKLKRFSLSYTIKILKNTIYTCSIFIFVFIYICILNITFNDTPQLIFIQITTITSLIFLYIATFIVIIRNYFTAIAVKDVLHLTKTDGYQSLRDIFR